MTILKHDFGVRPICNEKGCKNECQFMGTYKVDDTPNFRKLCGSCHNKKVAAKHGLKRISQVVAKNAGFDNETDYLNSIHPYRKYRKEYCENKDSRLGFKCNYKIRFSGQLQVDHINGNPSDDRPQNLQTLCANCHIFKTFNKGDNKTNGRKYFTELLKAA